MSDNNIFDDIRPYRDAEVHGVIAQLCEVPYFRNIVARLFPQTSTDAVLDKLRTIDSVDGFQQGFIIPFLNNLIKNCTDGVTASGLENLDPKGGYLFMSNHRDIILDSAFMNVMLHNAGFQTTEIAIGSNLLIYDWIIDLVKLNKSFIVKRGLSVKQMVEASATLSAYIRDSIARCGRNIWIAQREGRSKDGNDVTQPSLMKMLNLSGQNDVVANFAELKIVPVSITYEFDPCDYLKAHQFQLKRDIPDYKKSPSEDLNHMSTGLFGHKGRVHFAFGQPINKDFARLEGLNRNAQITLITEMIDEQLHANYRLWPDNYIALDELNGSKAHADKYTNEDVEIFHEYLDEHISRIDGADEPFIRELILHMYANPLINQEKVLAAK